MSRLYSQIQPSAWSGSTGVIIGADLETRVQQFNLLCGEQANSIGLYRLSPLISRAETYLSQEAFERTMRRLVELRFCEWEPTIERVWVRNMAARQWGPIDNINNLKSIRSCYQSCPECDLKRGFFAMYDGWYNLNGEASGRNKPKNTIPTPSQRSADTVASPLHHRADTVATPSTDGCITVASPLHQCGYGESTTRRPETGDRRPETGDQETGRPETAEPAPPSIKLNREESLRAIDADQNLCERAPLPSRSTFKARVLDELNAGAMSDHKGMMDILQYVYSAAMKVAGVVPLALPANRETWMSVALYCHEQGQSAGQYLRDAYTWISVSPDTRCPNWRSGESPFMKPALLWGRHETTPAKCAEFDAFRANYISSDPNAVPPLQLDKVA